MNERAAPQYAYRLRCPVCGDPGAQLRVVHPYLNEPDRAVIVSFACVDETEETHRRPTHEQLADALRDQVGRWNVA